MKRLRLMYFLLLLISKFSYSQNPEKLTFQDFKEGVFEAKYGDKIYIIERDNNFQLEKIVGFKGYIKYNIKWFNDKKYVLTYNSSTLSDKKLNEKYSQMKDSILVELTKIHDNYCHFRAILKGQEFFDSIKKVN